MARDKPQALPDLLDDRDPDYIRDTLPAAWLLATLWHRAEIRGLDNIPDEGPVLLVGNHSGGNTSPDSRNAESCQWPYGNSRRSTAP